MATITDLQSNDNWVDSRWIINTNINNLNTDKLDKVTDTLDDIPAWATNKHITQTQLNKIEAWVMLTDADCDTVTTWGRYWMIWTPVNWPQAWEFYLDVLSDWTRIMHIATYLDNTVWTRYYNWTVWSSWVFWKATWTNTWDQTNITWNAWTATALQTARTINWVSFDWTANISVPSDITPWTSWNVMTSNWTTWESQAPAWWGGIASWFITWYFAQSAFATVNTFAPIAWMDAAFNTTEAKYGIPMTNWGTFKKLSINITNNWTTWTWVLRKNWVDTALSVSVWASLTWVFSTTADVTFVAWDIITYRSIASISSSCRISGATLEYTT